MSDLSDAEARRQVRDSADRLLYAAYDIVRCRADRDTLWEVPGDLGDVGDGTGLLAIYRRQVLGPLREALERAVAEAGAIEQAIEDRKRRVIGPNYGPGGRP